MLGALQVPVSDGVLNLVHLVDHEHVPFPGMIPHIFASMTSGLAGELHRILEAARQLHEVESKLVALSLHLVVAGVAEME